MRAILVDIWHSFLRLPGWVKIWVIFVLGPVNLASLLFLNQPMGGAIAVLAYCGIAPNVILAFLCRGVSRLMALPHIVFWSPLMFILAPFLAHNQELPPIFAAYLVVLFFVNLVSLAFEFCDTFMWFRGDRAVF